MKNLFNRFILMFACFILFTFLSFKSNDKDDISEMEVNKTEDIKISSKNSLFKNYLDQMIVKEINEYINEVAPNSTVKGDTLWKVSKKYNINILLMLSQGNLESHFGTKGKATHTHSIFNVGTFDDGVVINQYNDPNNSIEPYAKLLSEDYNVSKTTNIDSLLYSDRFRNKRGSRFATSKHYESSLSFIIKYIKDNSNIDEYVEMYNNIK